MLCCFNVQFKTVKKSENVDDFLKNCIFLGFAIYHYKDFNEEDKNLIDKDFEKYKNKRKIN